MPLQIIPLLAGLLPFIGVHIAFELSVGAGQIPDCFPYFEGCTSISSAGRQPPGSFWFKGLMIPGAVFMAAYWVLMVRWLAVVGEHPLWMPRVILMLGLVSATGLVFYNMVLGHIGAEYRVLRQTGVTLYFGLGYLAQLIVTSRLYVLRPAFPPWIFNAKLLVCTAILVLGLLNVLVSAYSSIPGDVQDVIEWNIAILNSSFYVLTYFLWRATAFTAEFKVKPDYQP